MTQLIRSPFLLAESLKKSGARGKPLGLVPTMGYLHEGHLSLVRASRAENDLTVVSVFVNPTQFGPNEDFGKYPRDEARDAALLELEGADFIFAPAVEDMYLPGHSVFADESDLSRCLCGASRPGHFRGVCTVVLKLFNIVRPTRAYFGTKDYQQVKVIQRMVRDLNVPVEIRPCPIVREQDGLAMSSRNALLSREGRKAARTLYASLSGASALYQKGERRPEVLRGAVLSVLEACPSVSPEYVEIRDAENLGHLDTLSGPALLAIAARVEGVRLIDNAVLGTGEGRTGSGQSR